MGNAGKLPVAGCEVIEFDSAFVILHFPIRGNTEFKFTFNQQPATFPHFLLRVLRDSVVKKTPHPKISAYNPPMNSFQVVSPFQPDGDQPAAIDRLVQGVSTQRFQTLMGVTGSGKTFTM